MWQYCIRLIFSGWLGGINEVPYPERNQRLCGFIQRRRQLRRRQPMQSIQNPTPLPALWQSWPLSNSCEEFRKLNIDRVSKWLEDGKWCQKCRHHHTEDRCTLKSPCKTSEMHLAELHESIQEHKPKRYTVSLPSTNLYLDQLNRSPQVMVKAVKVLLNNSDWRMDTAVLEPYLERSIVLLLVV